MAAPDPDVSSWLKFSLLCDLHDAGKTLTAGQCLSAALPGFIGGPFEIENFEPTPWRIPVHVNGQIFEQVKELPPGTPITGIEVKRQQAA